MTDDVSENIFCSHLLAGVTAGLVIFSMSFTGVVLMYEPQISDYSERSAHCVAPSPDAKRLSYDELIAKIRAVSPKAHPAMITVKSDTRASVGVNLGRDNTVFINPYNGEILGGQSPTHNFLRDIVDRHRWLGVESEGRAAARAPHGRSFRLRRPDRGRSCFSWRLFSRLDRSGNGVATRSFLASRA